MLTSLSEIKRTADRFHVQHKSAIHAKMRWVRQEMRRLDGLVDAYNNSDDLVSFLMAQEFQLQFVVMAKYLRTLAMAVNEVKMDGAITDEMIEQARQYPISQLVRQGHGKVRCPAHDDKNPSAYIGTRTNRLFCPVCNTSWDAISLQRLLTGQDFKEAVQCLTR